MGVELYEPTGSTSTTIAGLWATLLFFGCCQPKQAPQNHGADARVEASTASGGSKRTPTHTSATPAGREPSTDAGASPEASAIAAKPSETAKDPGKEPYRIVALGDSITDEKSFGGGYLRYVAERCPKTRIDNLGKGGFMVNQIRRHFEDRVHNLPMGTYTHMIVYGGVNDLYSDLSAGRTPDKVEKDLAIIYEKARAKGIEVIAITVSPWGGFRRYHNARRQKYTEELNDWIRARATAGTVDHVVDSYPLLSCGQPDTLCPDYEQSSHDGLHLGKRGHEVLGQALYEQVFANCS